MQHEEISTGFTLVPICRLLIAEGKGKSRRKAATSTIWNHRAHLERETDDKDLVVTGAVITATEQLHFGLQREIITRNTAQQPHRQWPQAPTHRIVVQLYRLWSHLCASPTPLKNKQIVKIRSLSIE